MDLLVDVLKVVTYLGHKGHSFASHEGELDLIRVRRSVIDLCTSAKHSNYAV